MKILKYVIFLLMALVSFSSLAFDKKYFSTAPTTNNGEKWRIAYYEGGEYLNYQQVLSATVHELMDLGWMDHLPIPPQKGEQTKDLWNWLATNTSSKYVQFVADAYYTAEWDEEVRKNAVTQIKARIQNNNDIDLIIAMGTWAGQDIATKDATIPTIVLSASDPIGAGIIDSAEDSGSEFVHAHVDPDRWSRQMRIFHEIVGFSKLGIAYENSKNGRVYGAVDIVKIVATERDFDLVQCHTKSDIANVQRAEQSVIDCFKELVKTVDAIYVTEQGGVNNRSIPQLVRIANHFNIPTFAQYGSEMVKYGFLISTSTAEYRYIGQFHAKTFAKVFNGAKPNQLDQVFQEPPRLAINLKTATEIGFIPPLILFGAADEIYQEIVSPK